MNILPDNILRSTARSSLNKAVSPIDTLRDLTTKLKGYLEGYSTRTMFIEDGEKRDQEVFGPDSKESGNNIINPLTN